MMCKARAEKRRQIRIRVYTRADMTLDMLKNEQESYEEQKGLGVLLGAGERSYSTNLVIRKCILAKNMSSNNGIRYNNKCLWSKSKFID